MFNYEKFCASNTVYAPTVERVVEFSPPGVDAENIAKVLSLAVEGKVIGAEAAEGYADVTGRVNFKLLYLDREGAPKGVDYNADFSMKVEGDFAPDDTLTVDIAVVEADVVTGELITLSAVVEVRAGATKRVEFEALCDAEQCYKTASNICLPSFVAAKTVGVPVEDEIETGEVTGVLLLDTAAVVSSAEADAGVVRVNANAVATVTYYENDELKTARFEMPFAEEISLDGVEAGDRIQADAAFRNARIVLAGVTDANVLRFEGDVAVRVLAQRMREADVIGDLFMLTNEISVEKGRSEFNYFAGSHCLTERVEGSALLGDNRAAARDIIAIPYSRCYIAKAVATDDGAVVEGVVTADVIYNDENGLNSVRTEVPFSIGVDGEFAGTLKAACYVDRISARVRRDRELEVTAELRICLGQFCLVGAEYIKSVEIGEEKEQNTSALSMYIASEGDEMWDVCKALTATPEAIREQNPAMTTPLAEGERIVFFRALSL